MNKAYELKRTGTIKCTQVTTLGHILAHIDNARQYFGITSKYWGGPIGFEYSDLFPDYIIRVVRDIDIKYGPNQDRMYQHVKQHEVDYATEDDYIGEWPRIIRDYDLSIFEDKKPDKYADNDEQIQSWISTFRYHLHDASVSYIYSIGEHENKSRMTDNLSDNELRSIACDLADWKSSSRENEQIEERRMLQKTLNIHWRDGKPYIPAKEQQ